MVFPRKDVIATQHILDKIVSFQSSTAHESLQLKSQLKLARLTACRHVLEAGLGRSHDI
jgi:hypothetical protein